MTVSKQTDEYSAGGVVFRLIGDSIHFLLILDPYGKWGLPKGHVEHGESSKEAAIREVMEETGLTGVQLVTALGTVDWYYSRGRTVVHKYCEYFLMSSKKGAVTPQVSEGITDCSWFPMDEVLEVLCYENVRVVLERAIGILRSRSLSEILEK